MEVRLEKKYKTEFKTELMKTLNLKNVMEIPRIEKIVINAGVKNTGDSKAIGQIQEVISKIAGQAAVRTNAKKSVAGFKIRAGMPIGVKVTLRGKNMYNFLDKFINSTLPSVRDFHGISKKFDGKENYNIGISDWMVFPEIDYDNVDKVHGLNITIQTSANSDEKALELLKVFNMPFKKII
ncbi:MAG: 50S ribosomal protein L5 [bacterium]